MEASFQFDKQPTNEIIYNWLLRIAAFASTLFAASKLIFYLLIANIPNPSLAQIYQGYVFAAVVGAIFNIVFWFRYRDKPIRTRNTFILLLGNSILISVYYLFIFAIFRTEFVFLLIPSFIVLCLSTGLLCEFGPTLVLTLIFSTEFGSLMVWANHQGIIADPTVMKFAPGLCMVFFLLALPVSYVSSRMRIGEEIARDATDKLGQMNRQLETAQEVLSSYLAPQFARKIIQGEAAVVSGHHRVRLTLFFSDIKDFTATTDAMEPEDLAGAVNQYLDAMVTIANRHGGTVAQISGDGIFVFFGAPEFSNDEDHALRCVRMAVDMQREMVILQKKWFGEGIEHPFQIRCGVNTGLVTVGGFGSQKRRDYTAIGMQVNIAARLEAACKPGQILLSHSTWSLVHKWFPCIERETILVKGFHQPLKTYQIDLNRIPEPPHANEDTA